MKHAWTIALVAAAEPSNRVHTCLDLDKERRARLPKKSRQLERQWRQHDCESVPPAPPNIRRAGHSFLDAEMRKCDDLQTALIRHECYRQELDKEGQFLREVVDWAACPVRGVDDASAQDSWREWRCDELVGLSPVAQALANVRTKNAGKSVNDLRVEEAERMEARLHREAEATQSLHDAVEDIQADSRRFDQGRRVGGSMGETVREEAAQEAREWVPAGNSENFLQRGYGVRGFEAADEAHPPRIASDRRSGDL